MVDPLVKAMLFPVRHWSESFIVKAALGIGKMITRWVIESLQPLSDVAINLTVYVPTAEYVWVGLFRVEVVPSPNLHK